MKIDIQDISNPTQDFVILSDPSNTYQVQDLLSLTINSESGQEESSNPSPADSDSEDPEVACRKCYDMESCTANDGNNTCMKKECRWGLIWCLSSFTSPKISIYVHLRFCIVFEDHFKKIKDIGNRRKGKHDSWFTAFIEMRYPLQWNDSVSCHALQIKSWLWKTCH